MKHYNKEGFSVKCIEFDCEFKSIMNEVSDEMGIEINYENPDSSKYRFRIAY